MKRAILPCLLVLAISACGRVSGPGSHAEVLGEILTRLELTHARTVEACGRSERHCAAAAASATAALMRMRSDLGMLRVPNELRAAKRQWLRALDAYATASEALGTPSCAGRNLEACLRVVSEAKRSLRGGAAAASLGGVAAR